MPGKNRVCAATSSAYCYNVQDCVQHVPLKRTLRAVVLRTQVALLLQFVCFQQDTSSGANNAGQRDRTYSFLK
jgi:hypothetical protein